MFFYFMNPFSTDVGKASWRSNVVTYYYNISCRVAEIIQIPYWNWIRPSIWLFIIWFPTLHLKGHKTYLSKRSLSYSSCPAVSHKLRLIVFPSRVTDELKLSNTSNGWKLKLRRIMYQTNKHSYNQFCYYVIFVL